MNRVAGILAGLCGLACAGRAPMPAPIPACAEPAAVAAGSQSHPLLGGAVRIELPPGYALQDSAAGAPDETWMADGHGVVILDRAHLSPSQVDSIRAWGCRRELAGRDVYLRTDRGGDYIATYNVTAAWEEAPNDWVYVLAMAVRHEAHAEQFAALHTLTR